MELRLFLRLLEYDELVAEAQRDVEYRALHPDVDAVPIPEDPPAGRSDRLTRVRTLARTVPLLGLFGRGG